MGGGRRSEEEEEEEGEEGTEKQVPTVAKNGGMGPVVE